MLRNSLIASTIIGRLRIEIRSSSNALRIASSVSGDTLSGIVLSKYFRYLSARTGSEMFLSSSIWRCSAERFISAEKFDLTTSIRCVESTSIGVTTVAPRRAASSWLSAAIQRAGLA